MPRLVPPEVIEQAYMGDPDAQWLVLSIMYGLVSGMFEAYDVHIGPQWWLAGVRSDRPSGSVLVDLIADPRELFALIDQTVQNGGRDSMDPWEQV